MKRPPRKPPRARPPRARESLADGVRRLAAAVEAKDCERIRAIAFYGRAQLDAAVCKSWFLPSLRGFQRRGQARYRTAGVVDFKAPRSAGYVAFLVAADGRFRWALRLPRVKGQRAVGSAPPAGRRLDKVASLALRALRTGGCKRLQAAGKGVLANPRLPRRQCEKADWLRNGLQRDPSVRAKRLGAHSRLAFYSVAPRGLPYTTLVLEIKRGRPAFASVFAASPRRYGG